MGQEIFAVTKETLELNQPYLKSLQTQDNFKEQTKKIMNQEQITGFLESSCYEDVCICKTEEDLFIFSDRFGKNTVFYYNTSEKLYFSTELDSLVKCIPDKMKLNNNFFLRNIVTDCYVTKNAETAFEQVYSLIPNSYIKINKRTGLEIVDLVFYEDVEVTEDKIKKTFVENIKYSEQVGFLLSGGFDSSLILSTYCSKWPDAIPRVFSVLKDPLSGEKNIDSIYVEKLVSTLQNETELYSIGYEKKWTVEIIDTFVKSSASPIYDERMLLWFNLFSAASSKGVKKLYTGEGADELWYGYYPMKWGWISKLFHTELSSVECMDYFDDTFSQFILSNYLSDYSTRNILKTKNSLVDEICGSKVYNNNQKNLMYFLTKHVLWGLLSSGSNMSNLVDINLQVPFLEEDFANYALNLEPETHLSNSKNGKDILKKIFSSSLPKEIVEREKAPLPKEKNVDMTLVRILNENISEIKKSKLINRFFSTANIEKVVSENSSTFYGGINDVLLQLISMWRFEEIYREDVTDEMEITMEIS